MSTVDEVADRVYRDWLNSPEDQPVIITLSDAVTASATSWSFDSSALAPDEEELLAPGILIEAGAEQARIRDVDTDTDSLTVTRGVNGTDASAHASGDEIVVAPKFSRHSVQQAVKDAVVGLYPSLWHVATVELTAARGFIDVPAEVVSPLALVDGDGRQRAHEYLTGFPTSSSGRSLRVPSVRSGQPVYFTYESRFARPIDGDSELYELGVRPEWERIVAVGAAAQVVASTDLDTLTSEYITEQLQREALPYNAPQQIRNGLLTLYNVWLQEAHRALRVEHPIRVEMNV